MIGRRIDKATTDVVIELQEVHAAIDRFREVIAIAVTCLVCLFLLALRAAAR